MYTVCNHKIHYRWNSIHFSLVSLIIFTVQKMALLISENYFQVQQLLWKRKYDFTKALQAHRAAQSEMSKQKAEEEKEQKKKEAEKNSVGKQEDAKREECEEEKENSCISEDTAAKMGETGLATQDTSVEESEKTKAIGPAPGEDLVKLTSREKKKVNMKKVVAFIFSHNLQ